MKRLETVLATTTPSASIASIHFLRRLKAGCQWSEGVRILLLVVILSAPSLAPAAQGSQPLVSQPGKAAFSIDVPAGLKARSVGSNVTIRNAAALFELAPEDPGETAAASQYRIYVAYFKVSVPSLASAQWERVGRPESIARRGDLPRESELSHSDGLPAWYLTEATGSQLNAYINLGDDVVVVGLLSQGGRYEEGKRALLSILKSYREVEAGD